MNEKDHNSNDQHQTHAIQNLQGIIPFTRLRWKKVLLFLGSLVLFFFALELMKAGAKSMHTLTRGLRDIQGPLKGLGLGWFSSYLTLSGSPIAAIALALFDAETIDRITTFSMIVGSRLGGSLVVIFIGLLYLLQGHQRGTSLLTGILSFIVTGLIYVPAVPIGFLLLDFLQFKVPFATHWNGVQGSVINGLMDPILGFIVANLPAWIVFPLGVLCTVISLNLIDRSLPELDLEDNIFGEVSNLLYRPAISFLLGFGFTLLTMSVSISLGLLVPLSVRGYIRRENIVPYIMGCNISTFIDTIIAGILLRNPAATNIVLIQILSVLIVSILILTLAFRTFQNMALTSALWLNEDRLRMLIFFSFLMLAPLLLILL